MPYVAKSKIHGLGVFADKDYSVGDTIELCPYLVSDENDIGDECVLHDYMFYSPYEGEEDTFCIPLGLAMIYNHSETPNCELIDDDENTDYKKLKTIKRIEAGKELTLKYSLYEICDYLCDK